jgi:Na+-transporting methylmalonyl-CoA/oxaloacetate decarboxylase beta subunit
MLPIGFTMAVVNGGILIMAGKELGTLFVDPMASEPTKLLDALQINFLQPFYNFTFANGLIACLVFMGIGGITDLDFFIARPLIGIAAVSCVPTTAKVAQHCAMEVEETILILPHAMGPNVAGVITTAILCGIYVTLVPLF